MFLSQRIEVAVLQYMMRGESQRKQVKASFVPSPENKQLILNYFKYNNFQDFNTWQQIARTKLDYDYHEQPNHFQCRLTLHWDDPVTPLLHTHSHAHTKRTAKRRALALLIDQLICKALISRGFRQDNFVQHLPRRRRNYSDQSSEEELESQIAHSQTQALLASLLKQQDYQSCIQIVLQNNSQNLLLKSWSHALKQNSIKFVADILSALSKVEICQSELKWEGSHKSRQFLNSSAVKFALLDDLTDFMRYFQLSKDWEERKVESPALRKRTLPSEEVMSRSKGAWPQGSKLLQDFHPIELSKLVCDRRRLQKADNSLLQLQQLELPLFESPGLLLTLPTLQKMHFLLLFQCHNLPFCLHVLALMQRHLPLASIRLGSKNTESNQPAQQYYLRHKNNLTAQFIELLWNRIGKQEQAVRLQGMLMVKKHDEAYYQFVAKESDEFVNAKLNRKINTNQFDQMKQITIREMVLLQSKFTGSWVAQIVQVSAAVKLLIPTIQELTQPHPVTLIRLCNAKLFQKTSIALAQTSVSCMNLLEQNTHLIWQPPTFPALSVICELLLQWQATKQSVLILSPNSSQLHQNLQHAGFKTTLLNVSTDEKTLLKSCAVVSTPTAVCCDLLRNYAFSRVLVDQANAISEISVLSAAVKGCKHLWLIGDPYLPRMSVYSNEGRNREMNKSLFERLFKEGVECITVTSEKEQASHYQNVLGWVNKWLYRGQLRLLGDERQLPVVKGFLWPSSIFRICVLHHPQTETLSDYLNKQAELAATICNNILKTGYTTHHQIYCSAACAQLLPLLTSKLLQIIPQYLQKQYNIRQVLNNISGIVSGSRYCVREVSIMMGGSIEYMGDLCSLVGWLVQGRRGAILIGDVHNLAQDRDWGQFLAWCNSNKLICSLEF